MNRQNRTRRRGLTMLETVTAVGILAVAGATLMPVVKELDNAAKQTICQANQADFARTVMCYTSENQGAWLSTHAAPYPYSNASGIMGVGWQFQARLAYYRAGLAMPDGPPQVLLNWQPEHWQQIADCPPLWCPDAAGPESVTQPSNPRASHSGGFSPVNGIVGTSIVPNGILSPLYNFDPIRFAQQGHWPFDTKARVSQLEGSPDESLICADANGIGIRCWSDTWRGNYLGEYADPMFRHGSSYQPMDNMAQGWWMEGYGWGPPGNLIPRGNGSANVAFLDGHVETLDEATMADRWESGEINFALE